jgi:hypothetical protein
LRALRDGFALLVMSVTGIAVVLGLSFLCGMFVHALVDVFLWGWRAV